MTAVAALATAGDAAREPATRVEATAAWNGLTRPETWTEIAVRIVAARGGRLTVEATAGGLATVTSRDVDAGEAAIVAVPVETGRADHVDVSVRGAHGLPATARVPLHALALDDHVVGAPADLAAGALRDVADHVIALDPSQMPTTAPAFELLDVLVVTPELLERLDADARAAFERHLAACGRVIARGVGGEAATRLRERSGCGGSALRLAAADADVQATVRELIAAGAPPPFILARALSVGSRSAAAVPLATFLAGYVALLVVGGVVLHRPWPLLGVACVASLLLLGAFRASRPGVSLAIRAEGESGDEPARFAAVLRIAPLAPRRVSVTVPSRLGPPSGARTADSARGVVRLDGAAIIVEADAALFGARTFTFHGAVEHARDLVAAVDGTTVRSPDAPVVITWQRPATPPVASNDRAGEQTGR